MKVTPLKLKDVLLIEPKVHGDHRGFFMETYNQEAFKKNDIGLNFIQDNHSLSAQKGTLRGLHFQTNPMAQAKLIRCVSGSILDVAVDIRRGSPTFGQWVAEVLSAKNKLQLLVPEGFAHGFVTLEDNTEVCYKVNQYYSATNDRSILWSDPQIGINWEVTTPILSDKDQKAPLLADADFNFEYKI